MGKIIKNLTIIGDKGKTVAPVLLDSGASSSLIRSDIAQQLFESFRNLSVVKTFTGVDGKEALRSSLSCILELEMKGKVLDGNFYVVDNMSRDVIIGVDFMQQWEIKLDMKSEDYTVGIDPNKIEIL